MCVRFSVSLFKIKGNLNKKTPSPVHSFYLSELCFWCVLEPVPGKVARTDLVQQEESLPGARSATDGEHLNRFSLHLA